MAGKLLRLPSWSAMICLIFLFYLVGHVQISKAAVYCRYYKQGQQWPSLTPCPYFCCPNVRPTGLNQTCCQPVTDPTIITGTTRFSVFARDWIILVCVIGLCIALCIMNHFAKSIHVLKHSKRFNSVVDTSSAFTISKNGTDVGENSEVISEQKPPSYASAASSSPPPYASVNP